MQNGVVTYRSDIKDRVYNIPAELASVYEYLKQNILFCDENRDRLVERVKEIYIEAFSAQNSASYQGNQMSAMPSAEYIAGLIDTENISAIDMVADEMGLSEADVDIIVMLYCHDISCMLDDWTSEILWAIGMPVSIGRVIKVSEYFKSIYKEDQLRLSYAEVWEHG